MVWYDFITAMVEKRMSLLMVKFIFQQTKPIQDEDVLGCLNNLHEKFV